MPLFTGTEADDTLNASPEGDRLEGLGGNDQLFGRGGADTLLGGSGNDLLYGFNGSSGLDPNQEDRADLLDGGSGSDTLRGNSGDDTLLGGDGDDNLRGDAGNDSIDGGAGDDFVSYRWDQIGTQAGVQVDWSTFGGTPSFTLEDGQGGTDTLSGVERLGMTGTRFDDVLTGSALMGHQITAGAGNDSLTGGAEFDLLWGEAGDDSLSGLGGADTLDGGAGHDRLDGGAGDDTLSGGWDAATLDQTQGARGGGVDTLLGGEGNDVLRFGMERGDDRALMTGGAGADRFEFFHDGNGMPYVAASGLDRVLDFNPAEGDRLACTFQDDGVPKPTVLAWGGTTDIDFLNATQAPSSNVPLPSELTRLWVHVNAARNETLLFADANDNGLIDANDLLFALDGQHALTEAHFTAGSLLKASSLGSDADDLLQGGAEVDTLVGAGGNDTLNGNGGDDVLDGGKGSDQLNGGAGNDTLYGGWEDLDVNGARSSSRDTLDGGLGDDTLRLTAGDGSDHYEVRGGLGADRFVIDLRADTRAVITPEALDRVLDFNAAEGDKLSVLVKESDDRAGYATVYWAGYSSIDFANAIGQALPGGASWDPVWKFWVHHDSAQGVSTLFVDLDRDGYISRSDYMLRVNTSQALSALDFARDRSDLIFNVSNIDGDGANRLDGSANDEVLIGNGGNDSLFGLGGNDSLEGGDGDDRLAGGAGDDLMAGGQGDDSYWIEGGGDRVLELPDGGIDTVHVTQSYTLPANVESAILSSAAAANLYGNALDNFLVAGNGNNTLYGAGGTDTVSYADAVSGVSVSLALAGAQATGGSGTDTLQLIENLEGSAFSDRLTGNAGWNVLDGGAGNDTMEGGAGNDTYLIDSASDVVIESADALLGGNGDWLHSVLASTSLGIGIENGQILRSGAATLYGNALNNILVSGDGDSTLYGSGGVDTANYGSAPGAVQVSLAITTAQNTGASGLDTLQLMENLTGSGFADRLTGNASWNVIDGGNGADTIDGGLGGDLLRGGYGTAPDGAADVFVFSTRLDARLNLDRVIAFEADAMDRIQLDPRIFASLGSTLDASEFRLGTRALDADDFLLFDPATGLLRYDADGNGAGAAVAFAKLDAMLGTLDAGDFVVLQGGGG